MSKLLFWIIFIPFLSSFFLRITALFDTKKRVGEKFYSLFAIFASAISAVLSLVTAFYNDTVLKETLFNWISVGVLNIEFSLVLDRLSTVMILFITFIGTLIHIYAAGYMKGERRFGEFFAYFNFFMGSMLLLVLAASPVIMFIGWELVGLASFLLIGFYFEDPLNMKAANKAFILNRIGDFGFITALAILFVSLGGGIFSFEEIKSHIELIDGATLTLIGFLLFVGAMGKSAQIPLYVWLPDAMAGPTPVSALIHAATMVTAGVYMVARFSFLYKLTPLAGEFIALVGIFSALLAAVIASYQDDIKKILAYSTMSQLGYMFAAAGLGAYSSAIFHVFTHAFFKALLFMGAGAVIIALHHEQNIFKMGGLKERLKIVYITMMTATFAICGIPPFAGFFSKDAIISASFAKGDYLVWMIAVFTAMLTAHYMFRMMFIVFFKESKHKNLKSLPKSMIYPLIILAFGSATAGFLGVPKAFGGNETFLDFLMLPDIKYHLSFSLEYMLTLLNLIVVSMGIYTAYLFHIKEINNPLNSTLFAKWAKNKFYIDELYEKVFVSSLRYLSLFSDRVVDQKIFDGIIFKSVNGYRYAAKVAALLNNGNVRFYALYIMIGVSAISIAILAGGK